MPKVPRITGAQAKRAFENAGFVCIRISGSHHIMKKEGCQHLLSIPVHTGKSLGKGLLKHQITAAGLSVDEFNTYLR